MRSSIARCTSATSTQPGLAGSCRWPRWSSWPRSARQCSGRTDCSSCSQRVPTPAPPRLLLESAIRVPRHRLHGRSGRPIAVPAVLVALGGGAVLPALACAPPGPGRHRGPTLRLDPHVRHRRSRPDRGTVVLALPALLDHRPRQGVLPAPEPRLGDRDRGPAGGGGPPRSASPPPPWHHGRVRRYGRNRRRRGRLRRVHDLAGPGGGPTRARHRARDRRRHGLADLASEPDPARPDRCRPWVATPTRSTCGTGRSSSSSPAGRSPTWPR